MIYANYMKPVSVIINIFFACMAIETSARRENIQQALLDMVVKDMQPPSIVEDAGFRKFVSVLDPRYKLPLY